MAGQVFLSTDDSFIASMIRRGNTNNRYIIISEDNDHNISRLPGVITLPLLLPPVELIHNQINSIDRGQDPNIAKREFMMRYSEFLFNNELAFKTIHLIAATSAENDIYFYLSKDDFYNDEFNIAEVLISFIVQMLGLVNQNRWPYTSSYEYSWNINLNTVYNSITALLNTGNINLDTYLSLLMKPTCTFDMNMLDNFTFNTYGNELMNIPYEEKANLFKQSIYNNLMGIDNSKPGLIFN